MSAAGGPGWLGLLALGLGACAAELVFPAAPAPDGAASAGAPNDGITGQVGEGGAPGAPPCSRLQVPDHSRFSAQGGEGGAPAPGVSGAGASSGATAELDGESDGGAAGSNPGEPPAPPELYFSEYVEGPSSTKALEIYVVLATSLEGCDLLTYFNGSLEPARLALHGDVTPGSAYVLCSSQLAAAEPGRCDRSTNLTFNGNDSLALACAGSVLDVFGQIGVDPGPSWGDGASIDHTLRRSCSVMRGRVDG
ncbi:MAG TPA: hypothetical protein VIW29_02785, partial [Polyangiaceae bacterium]